MNDVAIDMRGRALAAGRSMLDVEGRETGVAMRAVKL